MIEYYLLSDGTITTDYCKSVIDDIATRLRLWADSIPRSGSNGIPKLYNGIDAQVHQDTLLNSVSQIVRSVSKVAEVDSIILNGYGDYTINIKIKSELYDVPFRT